MKVVKEFLYIGILMLLALIARFGLVKLLDSENKIVLLITIIVLFGWGIYLIKNTASIIEKTTSVLKDRTGLAGGLLQSLGTAFPDMVIGVLSAIMSLQAAATDPTRAINLAIIAASTTFGGNIYNVAFAYWCIWRQNLANKKKKVISMFPIFGGGKVTPLAQQPNKPKVKEFDISLIILSSLTFLTTIVALCMVLFGKVVDKPAGITGDLYRLNSPIGLLVLILCIYVLYSFRTKENDAEADSDNHYRHASSLRIWLELILAGIIIMFAAEGIIEAITTFSTITGIPFVLTGVATALIGCLGEMLVVYKFSIHPNGRIADAIVGVAMDNIVTTMAASFIAVIGGIFLGGDALIIIFILILAFNTGLINEISRLKNFYLKEGS